MAGKGTKESPWELNTPPGGSEYSMFLEPELKEKDVTGKEKPHPARIVCQVQKTTLYYDETAIDKLHKWLKKKGDWVELGAADEQKSAQAGTVEEFGRTEGPNDGWFGLKKGLRGRFGLYMPPLLEALGLAELTHDKKGNTMRAI
jgi:hypothetical protein